MQCLGIDFASRYSAAVLMDEHMTVLTSWVIDALPASKPFRVRPHIVPLREFVGSLTATEEFDWDNCRILLENLSHGMANPIPALKLHGVLETLMEIDGLPEPELILPSQWQAHYGFVRKSKKNPDAPTIKAQAKAKALELGYEFGTIGKATVDLYDAALIARYGIETK